MLYLTDAEIADLCAPLTQPAAQVRHLRALGLTVTTKPNGRPVVIRSHAEAVLSGRPLPATSETLGKADTGMPRPNIEGFMKVIQGGNKNGSHKKVQPA